MNGSSIYAILLAKRFSMRLFWDFRAPCIYKFWSVHPTNTHTHSHTLDRMSHMWKWHFTSPENVGWWTSVGVWIRPSSQSDRTKCTWNIGSIVAKRRWNFLKFPHHAISIHQRLSWYKTKRATCHKMLVCHKIHWIIVARHRCQKKAHTLTHSLIFFGDLFIAFTNLLACVSELNILRL